MRLLITVLITIFRFTITFGQSETSQTEIIIIGTIHNGNKHFNHRTLIDVLQKVKPDIILWEQSKNFKRVFGIKTANFFGIWKPGIEQLALASQASLCKGYVAGLQDSPYMKKNYLMQSFILPRSTASPLYLNTNPYRD